MPSSSPSYRGISHAVTEHWDSHNMRRTLIASYVLFAAAAICATAAPPVQGGQSDPTGKLNMISVNPERIEGVYHATQDEGIYFLGVASEDSRYLLITTLEGDVLVAMDRPYANSEVLMTMMGREFLILNQTYEEKHYLTGFLVPHSYSDKVQKALSRHHITQKLLRNLDYDNVNTSRQSAFQELLMRPEVEFIGEAAWILGNDMQVTASEFPAAMSFYVLAMRLTKAKDEQSVDKGSGSEDDDKLPLEREKRNHCWFWTTHCGNNGRCCYSCPSGSNCLGLCGRGCSCWWFICLNCCYNHGCYLHDLCCAHDYDTWGCSIPITFTCFYFYCYSTAPLPWGR